MANLPLPINIVALPLSESEWRVSDSSRIQRNEVDVVGFIQRIAGVYEALKIGAPLERSYFDSLAAAIAFFSEEENSAVEADPQSRRRAVNATAGAL